MAPRSASAQARSGTVDELQEVQITPRYVGSGMEEANARLDNNPINVIRSGSNASPDEVSAVANASSSGVIETVVSTAPRWRVGEENHYWSQQFTYRNAFGQFLSEDDATRSAAGLYQQDVRDQVATIRSQNTAILLDGFSPYGHVKNAAVGLWNLGVKAAGGAASLPYLLDSTDAAQTVQDWFGGARIDVDAPFAEMVGASLAPTVNQARAWSENTFGVGGSTVLGATGEFALDALALVGAGGAAQRFVPELDMSIGAAGRSSRLSPAFDLIEGTGRLGGELYSTDKLRQLGSYLERRGITLKVGDEYLPEGIAGGFSASERSLFLRSDPTNYEVWHELTHYRQYRVLGEQAYSAQSRLMKEQFVFDKLESMPRRWSSLAPEEMSHARWYIDKVGGLW